jgi:hypothetical protein
MMGQNTSSAVMAQRVEARGSLDDFPTPPWATRALLEALSQRDMITPERQSVRDPAANRGHMVRPLSEQFARVEAADVHDYGAGFEVADYLLAHDLDAVDWTITNPPFRLAEAFLDRALATSRSGIAFIVLPSFLEGAGRYHSIFRTRPPALVLQFSERVIMAKERLLDPARVYSVTDRKTGEIVLRHPSTATAYACLVWHPRSFGACHLGWIEPCRRRFEVQGDYPADPFGLAQVPHIERVCGCTRLAVQRRKQTEVLQ